jgi:hypothetical protein
MKKYLIVVFVLLLSLSGCVTTKVSWDTTDKVLLGATYTTMAVDTIQTLEIVTNSAFMELNPVISVLANVSPTLVPVYFIGLGITYYLIADNLKSDYRKIFLTLTSFMHLGAVVNNFSIGVRP